MKVWPETAGLGTPTVQVPGAIAVPVFGSTSPWPSPSGNARAGAVGAAFELAVGVLEAPASDPRAAGSRSPRRRSPSRRGSPRRRASSDLEPPSPWPKTTSGAHFSAPAGAGQLVATAVDGRDGDERVERRERPGGLGRLEGARRLARRVEARDRDVVERGDVRVGPGRRDRRDRRGREDGRGRRPARSRRAPPRAGARRRSRSASGRPTPSPRRPWSSRPRAGRVQTGARSVRICWRSAAVPASTPMLASTSAASSRMIRAAVERASGLPATSFTRFVTTTAYFVAPLSGGRYTPAAATGTAGWSTRVVVQPPASPGRCRAGREEGARSAGRRSRRRPRGGRAAGRELVLELLEERRRGRGEVVQEHVLAVMVSTSTAPRHAAVERGGDAGGGREPVERHEPGAGRPERRVRQDGAGRGAVGRAEEVDRQRRRALRAVDLDERRPARARS